MILATRRNKSSPCKQFPRLHSQNRPVFLILSSYSSATVPSDKPKSRLWLTYRRKQTKLSQLTFSLRPQVPTSHSLISISRLQHGQKMNKNSLHPLKIPSKRKNKISNQICKHPVLKGRSHHPNGYPSMVTLKMFQLIHNRLLRCGNSRLWCTISSRR